MSAGLLKGKLDSTRPMSRVYIPVPNVAAPADAKQKTNFKSFLAQIPHQYVRDLGQVRYKEGMYLNNGPWLTFEPHGGIFLTPDDAIQEPRQGASCIVPGSIVRIRTSETDRVVNECLVSRVTETKAQVVTNVRRYGKQADPYPGVGSHIIEVQTQYLSRVSCDSDTIRTAASNGSSKTVHPNHESAAQVSVGKKTPPSTSRQTSNDTFDNLDVLVPEIIHTTKNDDCKMNAEALS